MLPVEIVVCADNPAHNNRTAANTIQNLMGAQRLIRDLNIPSPSLQEVFVPRPKTQQAIHVKQDAALDGRRRCGDTRKNKTSTQQTAIYK